MKRLRAELIVQKKDAIDISLEVLEAFSDCVPAPIVLGKDISYKGMICYLLLPPEEQLDMKKWKEDVLQATAQLIAKLKPTGRTTIAFSEVDMECI